MRLFVFAATAAMAWCAFAAPLVKGWRVGIADSMTQLRSLEDAAAALKRNPLYVEDCSIIAFLNWSDHNDIPFPGKDVSGHMHFALRARGTMRFPSAGTWTFAINSDDGFKMGLRRGKFSETFASPGATRGMKLFTVSIPAAGDYDAGILYYNLGGPACLMVFAAKGQWATYDMEAFLPIGAPDCEITMRPQTSPLPRKPKKQGSWSVVRVDNVRSLDEAEAKTAHAAKPLPGAVKKYPVIALGGSAYNFPGRHSDFPGGGGDYFGARATAKIRIPSAGVWTFSVGVDDYARIRITRKDFSAAWDQTLTDGKKDIKTITFPSAGDYDVEIVFHEVRGRESLEFSAAKGQWTSFDPSAFKLVGDPACEISLVDF
ncbi:MAG: hypothetical protein IJ802_01690 [Kiritimatiellae bacterium]|nr:hypothetical protein [Kiritimatiellia bacterium]